MSFKKAFSEAINKYTPEEKEQFRKESLKNNSVKAFFVKKTITKKAWSGYYADQGTYCLLHNDFGGMEIGFLSAKVVPEKCLEITDVGELEALDKFRKAINLSPFVFDDNVAPKKAEITEEEQESLLW